MNTPSLRPARRDDARALAELVQVAGAGIPTTYLWALDAAPEEQAADIGERLVADDRGPLSYRNVVLVQSRAGGEVIGLMLGYVLSRPDASRAGAGPELTGLLEPILALEGEAIGSYYVRFLAVREDWKGAGVDRLLFDAADERAVERGADTLSAIAYEQDRDAVTALQRDGFGIVDRRAIDAHPAHPYDSEVLLLTRPVR